MKRTAILFSLGLFLSCASIAQNTSTSNDMTTGNIGKMSVATFNNLNAKGGAAVKAIKPTKTQLSNEDNALLMQVAMGGQKQLAISQAALNKVTSPQAKLLSSSEAEEQNTVAAKLHEIADAKGITLPSTPDTSAQSILSRMEGMSGSDLDAFYVRESGVKGHEELQRTMTTVNSSAKDPALKAMAAATLPVIRTHLQVSREVSSSMPAAKDNAMKQ